MDGDGAEVHNYRRGGAGQEPVPLDREHVGVLFRGRAIADPRPPSRHSQVSPSGKHQKTENRDSRT